MNLCIYSSGLHVNDVRIDEAVYNLLSNKRNPRLSMLLASPDAYHFVVPAFSRYLQEFCSTTRNILVPENTDEATLKEEIESSDLLFLSGGNTYHFLHNIRKFNLAQVISNFAKNGGIIAGSSAGAILMTPTIKTAEIPTDDADENNDNITDLTALGLVKFEVSPHYISSQKADTELRHYSLVSGKVIYGLSDGTGILLTQSSEKMFGSIMMFTNGEQSKVNCSC